MPSKHATTRLVIVESPTKARTIKRFLPAGYQVEASMGHVRDLPSNAAEIPDRYKKTDWARLGVNVDAGFEPIYVISPKKRAVVNNLKAALKAADEVYIATDEDREGESIGWHLVEVLQPDVPVKRMVFHEITERAILEALGKTRDIDTNLVDAQETRRVLDRLVGYAISPLLWRKIAPKLSAGRVQSVAVRLLVMRERERMSFVSAAYWDMAAKLGHGGTTFDATLTHLAGVRVAGGRDYDPDTGRLKAELRPGVDTIVLTEARARELASAAETAAWQVAGLEEREQSRSPAAPFTTSTLQQEAGRKLGLSARDTMRVAQSLYENGYITYMRTDSTSLSQEALSAARAAITRRYGADYLSAGERKHKGGARNAQEAHEAIRPAGTEMRTAQEHGLKGVEAAVYDLVWKRTVASQMADARLKFVTARINAGKAGMEELTFRATGRTVLFPGFFRAYVEGSDDPEAALDDRDQPLPLLATGDGLDCAGVTAEGHETKPPARFTEASLVKLLEAEGIGRPSTYASIIDTIQARGYARKQSQQLVPTFTAFATNNLLERQFRQLVDTEFTAQMEQVLDDIAAGERASGAYLRDFYLGSEGIVRLVDDALEAIDARQISTVENAAWDPYVVRVGRYGPYVEGPLDGETRTASLPPDAAPGDLTKADLTRYLTEGNMGDVTIATEPGSGTPVLLKRGPFGPYLQLGEAGSDGGKPKRVSLPPGVDPHEVSSDLALRLIALPACLGDHPDDGKAVDVGIGRFGPYVKHGSTFASIPKAEFVLDVDLERALQLLAQKARRGSAALRVVGTDPRTGEAVELYEGRFGPYVKRGSVNASLPRDVAPEALELDEAVALLDAREAAGPAKGRGRGRAKAAKPTTKSTAVKATSKAAAKGTKTKAASGGGKAGARKGKAGGKATSKAAAKTKATPEQLTAYLGELEPADAAVAALTLGAGGAALDVPAAAARLGIGVDDAEARNKRAMFKLRMSFGRDRAKRESGG
ncbi:MAG: type I DNA topoisomerase [Trueperaceae bacterium]|nr:type I DNA topoisomerase [Trueperaceae bacterium]